MPTPTKTKVKPEDAVRRYMHFLEDPKQLIDQDAVDKARQDFTDAVDPIDKLKALALLDRASNIDEVPLRADFVAHAKAWAETAGVTASGFTQMKVPAEVLREAGFDVRVAARTKGGAPAKRAAAVTIEDIKPKVLDLPGTFLLADIITHIGGSQATVRKALDELIDAGKVEKLGPVPNYSGRGRAPLQYEVKTSEVPASPE